MAEFSVRVMMPDRIFMVGIVEAMQFFPVLALNCEQMASLVWACNKAWDSYRPPEVAPGVRSFIESLESIDEAKHAGKDN